MQIAAYPKPEAATRPQIGSQRTVPGLRGLALVRQFAPLATACVILLGILREIFIARFGTGTALKDLRPFNLDTEHCLGAWYESSLMLGAALLLYAIGSGEHRSRRMRRYWFALAVLFVGLSLDESVSMHEILIVPLREYLQTGGALYFAWVIPGTLFVLAAGAWSVPFLLALPRRTAIGLVTAGGLFVGGALGMELVGGYLVSNLGPNSVAYTIAAITEESLEMIGLTVFLGALIGHFARHCGLRLIPA